MTRAEQKALEKNPVCMVYSDLAQETYDVNEQSRLDYCEGYKQAEKDTIERVEQWLFSHLPILISYYQDIDADYSTTIDRGEFLKDLRKAMEE